MRGHWRLFRHEAGRVAGPPAWVYVLLFAASQLIGHWSVATFDAIAVWLSNGILAAALLQLHRRPAVAVMTACLTINLFSNVIRGDVGMLLWLNALLNMGEAFLCAFLARRVCGAALDMRRPKRLLTFAAYSAVPAVAVTAAIGFGLVLALTGAGLNTAAVFGIYSFFIIELLGLLLVTPVLLLVARAHRFKGMTRAGTPEAVGLFALMLVVTTVVFWQKDLSVAYLTFPPMLLICLRLSPTKTAAALILLAGITGAATLTGHGPVHLTRLAEVPGLEGVSPMLRRLGIYNLYLLAMVATVLPISTVMTERRRLETRLRARTLAAQEARRKAEDAAAARSRFLAMMSHEMRTPLNGVAGFADVLASRPGLDADAVRQARLIRESSDGLLMLVEDILDFARGDDALTTEALDLVAVARETATASLAAAQARGLKLRIDDRLPVQARFIADRRVLRQALHPLIANAVKFTEQGEVVVRLDRAGDGVCIRVSDTGCGIEPSFLPELFEAFAQGDASIRRNHSGAGLGLALAARQVRRMGGQIDVDSRVGEGSTFILKLPFDRAADVVEDVRLVEEVAAPAAAPAEESGRAPCVLVVDDHPVNREVARIMLEAFGCEVVEVCDGQQALDAVAEQPFDLVLMDVRMPNMDGLEATRRIRSIPGTGEPLSIVAMTADAMPEDVARCLAAGMNAHMAKPINQAGLLSMVNRALSGDLPAARVTLEAEAA
ncbi:response regulator [uncultured Brevundimonas sp.]|uniref:hybrid sensor histidine kinase/response regulator n=1 Tax=uncultured Brevundimonas sp. TaxID=213418 RepID=UPI002632FED8|nr:response regulator [uncultured Brevundimonas sp.]HRJ62896.1 response regulator [Brevundimonas sp.]